MPTLSHPDPDTPGTPRVSLDVPDDWEQLAVADTLLAARETEDPPGGFATNVTVQHLRRPAAVTESILVDELRELMARKDQGQVGDPYQRMVNDQPVHGVNVSYVDPAAGTLAQVHLFARHQERDQASLVHLVLTFAGARSAELGPVLRDIGLSLKINWSSLTANRT